MAANKSQIEVPFESEVQAKAVYNALFPEPELKPDEIKRTMTLQGSVLKVQFEAVTARSLRVGVNGFMDNLALSIECTDEFA